MNAGINTTPAALTSHGLAWYPIRVWINLGAKSFQDQHRRENDPTVAEPTGKRARHSATGAPEELYCVRCVS